MKNIFVTITLLMLLSFNVHAQIQVEEAKPQAESPSQPRVIAFDSTRNSVPITKEKGSYIGKEIFFLAASGDFFNDSLAEHRVYPKTQLKYYMVIGENFVSSREYFDERRMDFVQTKSRHLYKIKEKGTDNIVWYDPELYNPLMPGEDDFSLYDVIWVSYYNYLKTEYIGGKYALTHSKEFVRSLSDHKTGTSITYKYNDIWTVEDVKVIKSDAISYKDVYVLRLALKNNTGNVITISQTSNLLVGKATYDKYIKQYGAVMVKSAFEGDLKVGMPKDLVYHITKHYRNKKGDNVSVAKTSKGEEWTIRTSSKTLFISFNAAGKVTSWKEEDTQSLRMTGKVSVSPR